MILAMTNLNLTGASNPVTTTGPLKAVVEVVTAPRTPSQVVDSEVRVTPKDMEVVEVEPTAEEINMAVRHRATMVLTKAGVEVAALLVGVILNGVAVEANLMTIKILGTDPAGTHKAMEAVVTPNLGITVMEVVDTELTREANREAPAAAVS